MPTSDDYEQGNLFSDAGISVLEEVVTFGQYKGMPWRYVLNYDRPYFEWAATKADRIDPNTQAELLEILEEEGPTDAYDRFTYGDD